MQKPDNNAVQIPDPGEWRLKKPMSRDGQNQKLTMK